VRNTELGAQRAKEIGGSTSIAKIDLADLSSVRAFADALDGDVDILINNAGLITQTREETVDGFEKQLGTNLLGPFALTNLIFPKVRSQIINVGSHAHRAAELRLDDMHLRTGKWTMMGSYRRSKLGVMLWGLELDRRLRAANSPVVSQLTHPGWVASNLSNVSDQPVLAAADKVVRRVANVVANDIDAGAASTLYCISEPVPPGSYIGYDGPWGLSGPLVMLGRTALAGDYDAAAKVVEFAERETSTTLPV